MRHFRFIHRTLGEHVHIDVRVAASRQKTHALCGSLTMTRGEFNDWRTAWEWAENRGEAEFVDGRAQLTSSQS